MGNHVRALEKKGYRIVRSPFQSEEEFLELRDQMREWFDTETNIRLEAKEKWSRE